MAKTDPLLGEGQTETGMMEEGYRMVDEPEQKGSLGSQVVYVLVHPVSAFRRRPRAGAGLLAGLVGSVLLIVLLSVYLTRPLGKEAMLRKGQVIPDVLDGVNLENGVTITIVYGSTRVRDGMELTPTFTANQPTIIITGTGRFTLIMSDPDAPSPTDRSLGEYLHWMVTDIADGDISKGNTLVPYVGPGPPEGLHRYIFGLYRQPNDAPLNATAPDRPRFHQRDFAGNYSLGYAVDASWFGARPEV